MFKIKQTKGEAREERWMEEEGRGFKYSVVLQIPPRKREKSESDCACEVQT